ncbi:cellular nucleic acid binding protein, putative [Entamoeba invadens IP1]|uniref:Cellular nucleic acid binding protein, putative n=1 Tax=Entamoeba invadens IP1 TaxID=370355 RepID=A0A0A1U880_ENTIV|nr:cellular nucleic acid binding protein, putative [Entamoeba invadens IP1]ELP91108.1 cellular nucleic acid binding protein, putative [Entamoeba invadens IP1]|eukprot:XP_004257879.1 cellular nucleic acid binding protein, putative [Entamoeba invadens IP1]
MSTPQNKSNSKGQPQQKGEHSQKVNVFIGNLPRGATVQSIFKHFEGYKVDKVRIIKHATESTKGYGFLTFKTLSDAENIVNRLNNDTMGENKITLQLSTGKKASTQQKKEKKSQQESVETMKCYTCGLFGHTTKYCPNSQEAGKCFICGESGHFSNKCPQREEYYNTNKQNHQGTNEEEYYEEQEEDPHTDQQCYKCGSSDHIAKNCPDAWKYDEKMKEQITHENGSKEFQENEPVQEKSIEKVKEKKTKQVGCYKCGSLDHIGRDCPDAWKYHDGVSHTDKEQIESEPQEEKFNKKDSQEEKLVVEKKLKKSKGAGCYLCGNTGHNGRDCPDAWKYTNGKLDEKYQTAPSDDGPQEKKSSHNESCGRWSDKQFDEYRTNFTQKRRPFIKEEVIPKEKPKDKPCYKCGKYGHISKDCPDAWKFTNTK